MINDGRDYNIPESSVGFYSVGLAGLGDETAAALQSLFKPIEHFLDFTFARVPSHISCRYLGYRDEVSRERVDAVLPKLSYILEQYLPIECQTGRIFASWHTDPARKKKLFMVEVHSDMLAMLHRELLLASPDFPLFPAVSGIRFKPHVSAAHVKLEYFDPVPPEIDDFLANQQLPSVKLRFEKAFFFSEAGMQYL